MTSSGRSLTQATIDALYLLRGEVGEWDPTDGGAGSLEEAICHIGGYDIDDARTLGQSELRRAVDQLSAALEALTKLALIASGDAQESPDSDFRVILDEIERRFRAR